jgi:hypothetical protein
VRPPNPPEVGRIGPIAIRCELFRAPHVFIVVIRVVPKPLCEVILTIEYPLVDRISRNSQKLPIARAVARDDKLRRTAVTQRKPRRVRINPRAAPVAHAQTHTSFARHVDAIKPRLFRGHRRSRRVDFEIFLISVELEQSHNRRAFKHTQRDAFVAQSYDSQSSVRRKAHIVTRVDLDFHPAFLVGGDDVAFDEGVIQPGAFPVCVPVAFEVHFPGD